MSEGPLHARNLAGAAVDDELHGAPGAVIAGEVDAFLEVDSILVGGKCPHLLGGQHQHGAVGIRETASLHRGMKVEPDRELVAAVRERYFTRLSEPVLAYAALAIVRVQ